MKDRRLKQQEPAYSRRISISAVASLIASLTVSWLSSSAFNFFSAADGCIKPPDVKKIDHGTFLFILLVTELCLNMRNCRLDGLEILICSSVLLFDFLVLAILVSAKRPECRHVLEADEKCQHT